MNGNQATAVLEFQSPVDSCVDEQKYPSDRVTWSPSVRFLLALLLLVAAGLKSYQLIDKPVPAAFVLGSRWLTIMAIEWELFLGLWLVSGVRAFFAWWGALLTFGLFSAVSFVKAVSGDSSCGCFGYVEVSPWITLVIDVFAVGALLWARRQWNGRVASEGWPGDQTEWQHRRKRPGRSERPGRWSGFRVVSFLIVGSPLAIWIARAEPSRLDGAAGIIGTGDLVILEPELWVGERFPLLAHLDLEADVSTGLWNVVLYHETCPKCQEVLPEYMDLATRKRSDPMFPRLALLETAADGRPLSKNGPWETGKLSADHEWFVTAPVQINVRDGTVTEVLDDGAISAWLKRQSGTGESTGPPY